MSHDRPISIHALREEGDLFSQVCKDGIVISIHALREEGDGTSWSWRTLPCISIHALREEGDIQARLFAAHDDISIHALREEGDDNDVDKFIASFDFYPRPPRGGRPTSVGCVTFWFLFLSTPSARRATSRGREAGRRTAISIHALREEGDGHQTVNIMIAVDFYPRPPRGGRR